MLRTHSCGELRKEHTGTRVTLAGWVDRRRDHGGLIFIDLRGRDGIVQVVYNPEVSGICHETAGEMRSEYVVQVTGEVAPRPRGTENPRLPTGEIEVIAGETRILNPSITPPFYINEDIEIEESLRLKYRYLDIRRARMKNNIFLRHRVVKYVRDFLDARGFIEVETPILIKSTPEGARDYLVPSRVHPGEFYALPQSPQQLKQLLMVAGVEKYFQIARCFRDEDLRADRQPEFTQLDMEMSFIEEEDIISLMEEMFTALVTEVKPEMRMIKPFPRLKYAEAMERYGTDKPDLRFGMEIKGVSDIVGDSDFSIFRNAIKGGGVVKGICAPGCAGYTRHQLEELNQIVRSFGAEGVINISIGDNASGIDDLSLDMLRSVAIKYLTLEQVKAIAGRLAATPGDLLLIMAGKPEIVAIALGELRLEMGRRLNLAAGDSLAFAFILDFPLFKWDEKMGYWETMHHPFTAPKDEDACLVDTEPGKMRGKHYDIVCNGYEIAGGSLRIYSSEMQRKVFRMLGYKDADIDDRFGHLLEAFDYGAPPHGGIASGIDRLVMLLAGEQNIREVIAFPKTQSAIDLTLNAPSAVGDEQLRELHLRITED